MELLRAVLIWWLAIGVMGGIRCPEVSCQPYQKGICAVNAGSELHVNTNPCNPTETCSITSLLEWWSTAQPQAQYLCSSQPVLLRNTTITPAKPCLEVESAFEFKAGLGRVSCLSDEDCQLQDGAPSPPGTCVCTLQQSGLGVCMPNQRNPVFEGYWDDCDSDNLGNLEILYFWSFYLSMWPYLQTDIPCSSYLAEVDTFTTLYILYSQAGAELLHLLLLPLFF